MHFPGRSVKITGQTLQATALREKTAENSDQRSRIPRGVTFSATALSIQSSNPVILLLHWFVCSFRRKIEHVLD
jgi:hypothetical protein